MLGHEAESPSVRFGVEALVSRRVRFERGLCSHSGRVYR
jgi:hypothetical protein